MDTNNTEPYPHWQRDCRRWGDVVTAVNLARDSRRDDLRRAAEKVTKALTEGSRQAGQDIFLGLLTIDAPLAYAFDYRGFDAWIAERVGVATTLAPCADGMWRVS